MSDTPVQIRRALISVSDKSGIVDFAQGLVDQGVQLISTGGTAKLLADAGLEVTEVSQHTGLVEMLDGRVKTLHPRIHGGILARRSLKEHMDVLQQQDIDPIDLVCVNLYPFSETVSKSDTTLEEAIENIDIGGPAMIRSAAKNYTDVIVVTDSSDYMLLLDEIKKEGGIGRGTRFALAKKAFSHTARYDGAIANWLTALDVDAEKTPGAAAQLTDYPANWHCAYERVHVLRYGENPHQSAAWYKAMPVAGQANGMSISDFRSLQGKELSYNNLNDADAAWECVKSFDQAACVIVKHANPCGVAIADNSNDAYHKAFQTDPTSAFGGIVAFNTIVDADLVASMNERKHFVEVLIAPALSDEAKKMLATKQNLRVLIAPEKNQADSELPQQNHAFQMKQIGGGLLLQSPDHVEIQSSTFKVVTKKAPTAEQMQDLRFAWQVAKFVKSNAIVFCRDGMTLGVGAGQMSRIDSTKIAAIKAHHADLSLQTSCVASDAFFPFRDGVDALAEAGAGAVIQPGGSVRDEEVIAAADEHGLAMVFTGIRHFRH